MPLSSDGPIARYDALRKTRAATAVKGKRTGSGGLTYVRVQQQREAQGGGGGAAASNPFGKAEQAGSKGYLTRVDLDFIAEKGQQVGPSTITPPRRRPTPIAGPRSPRPGSALRSGGEAGSPLRGFAGTPGGAPAEGEIANWRALSPSKK